jgi:hypothetical protein
MLPKCHTCLMIVPIQRWSEARTRNPNDRRHCCSESEFRQGWEGNLPEELTKTSQPQELDSQVRLCLTEFSTFLRQFEDQTTEVTELHGKLVLNFV